MKPIDPRSIVWEQDDYNDFWTVPKRNVYNLGDYFDRNSDLLAFALSSGNVIPVPVDQVTISIISNPNSTDPDEPIPVSGNTYRLSSNVGSGRKLIVVTYEDKTTEYSIEVMDPHSLDPGNGGGGGGDNGSGIGITWA